MDTLFCVWGGREGGLGSIDPTLYPMQPAHHRNYILTRVEFRSSDGAVDDAEWFFVDPESDAIIEFRSARRGDKGGDNGANLRRLEKIRIALGFEKVPVLRNRRRALFIMESPLDAFGPSYGVDAPPPQEVRHRTELH